MLNWCHVVGSAYVKGQGLRSWHTAIMCSRCLGPTFTPSPTQCNNNNKQNKRPRDEKDRSEMSL